MSVKVPVGTTAADEVHGGDGHLADLLDRSLLEERAGWLVYMRGVDYAACGHVTDVRTSGHRATAVVQGTRPYDVAIEHAGSTLVFDCSCPMGATDDFCKHLVALGVELIGDIDGALAEVADDVPVAGVPEVPAADVPEVPRVDPDAVDLDAWLAELPADRLRELLAVEAARSPEVRRRLSVIAAADTGEPPELSSLRARVTDAFAFGHHDSYGYVHYRDAYAWAQDVEAVIDEVEQLLAAGFAAETIGLAETILAKLDESVGYVDDSDGHLYDLFDVAMDLHLRACEQAGPDPVALAGRLLHWAVEWELDRFQQALGDYAHVLGDTGLAAYRQLAERRWDELHASGSGSGSDDDHDHHDRFAITTVMEQVAEVTGGLDELLEVMRHDLGSGYAFLRIAAACRRHGRDDLALDWAQRGRRAFPDDPRLIELIGDVHADNGRDDEALAADRDLFAADPSLARYQRLKARAERAGAWPAERDAALSMLRDRIERRQRGQRTSAWARADGSTLVEILLWDGDADATWEAAQSYGCNDGLWLHVAAMRGEGHPKDAIDVYRRLLDRALEPAKDRAYNEVVRLLKLLRPLYDATGRADDFDRLVSDIRGTYKRRRNLIARLDHARL